MAVLASSTHSSSSVATIKASPTGAAMTEGKDREEVEGSSVPGETHDFQGKGESAF